jgi:hypothetical protein
MAMFWGFCCGRQGFATYPSYYHEVPGDSGEVHVQTGFCYNEEKAGKFFATMKNLQDWKGI